MMNGLLCEMRVWEPKLRFSSGAEASWRRFSAWEKLHHRLFSFVNHPESTQRRDSPAERNW